MIFSTYTFIFIFLPIVLIIYFGISKVASKKIQHIFLILASLVFYGYSNPWYVLLILVSIILNYFVAIKIETEKNKYTRKFVFILGVIFNVGLLGYFKYYNFFIDNLNEIFSTSYNLKHIILPVGISFFTFQQIATLISFWKRDIKVPSFIDYSLFISFFPQLVAGPIVFAQDIIPQYCDDKRRFFNLNNFSKGIFIFIIGLFKKIVIADSLSHVVSQGFLQTEYINFGQAWVSSISYTLQIFFDFSGYSDMAIGLAKMFNFDLPINFYSPYKSKSITEFWKRWHITLGRSLAVLIYFPLGGNRKGLPRTCLNLFIVFLVSGIWHGASWTFIFWGIMHGFVCIFEKLFAKYLDKISGFIRVFFTFMFVNAAWVLFRAKTIDQAIIFLKKMFLPETISFTRIPYLTRDGILNYPDWMEVSYIIGMIAILLSILFFYPKNSIDLYNNFSPNKKIGFIIAIIFCISIIHLSKVSPFIYFNF